MPPFVDQIITAIVAFTLGGGFWNIVKARSEARQRDAEAAAVAARTVPEVADLSVSTLVKVNEQLVSDYERVKAERDDYYNKFEALRAEVEALQAKLEAAQADLRSAHEATAALRVQLDTLMSSLDTTAEEVST